MKKYFKGQKFIREVDNSLYVLALVGTEVQMSYLLNQPPPISRDLSFMCLIDLRTGDRWTNAIKVEDCRNITEAEFEAIGGSGRFKPASFAGSHVAINTETLVDARVK